MSKTKITMSTSIGSYVGGLVMRAAGYWEVSNIHFDGTGTKVFMILGGSGNLSEGFRVHHNTFKGYKIRFGWSYGVLDHNTFDDSGESIDVRWSHSLDSSYSGAPPYDGKGSYSWALGGEFGTEKAVFIENNVFYHILYQGHPVTSVNGGRYVFRFNTVQ